MPDRKHGSGAGSSLPAAVLTVAGVSTLVAVLVSSMSVYQHLKSYRKPVLQRMVIRIMIMVPIYGVSSLIALFSLDAAFFIDAIRDIYEAFVIYCFFQLLLSYLGGERSLLILLHGRPPKTPVFPINIFKHEIDVSDPYTFLFLKRGILQYVQVKPILAAVTLVLKATGKYNDGDFRANSGYLYISIIYNTSICLSLYCLAMFWVVVNDDLKPFRPIPKFLCVKGILFFSFWQAIGVSVLVAAGAISHLGPYTDAEHISLALIDTLITIEMPLFAIAHMFAFAPTDFADPTLQYVARMPMYYAVRDAFGIKDVVEDSRATLHGEGMDYRAFEPSEGFIHQGAGRERRIKAGLRYSKGGKRKYWLPRPNEDSAPPGRLARGVNRAIRRMGGNVEDVRAPLLVDADAEAEGVVHLAPDLQPDVGNPEWDFEGQEGDPDAGYELPFGDIDPDDEAMFEQSKRYLFGDYNYPTIDISSEAARGKMWDEEERVLRDERGAWVSPIRARRGEGYGAIGTHPYPRDVPNGKGKERDVRFGEGDRLIDYEQDKTAAEEGSDVKLKWTNVRRKSPQLPSSQTSSPRPRSRKHSSNLATPTSSSLEGNKTLSPPAPRPEIRTLPSDAVDLVVEDPEAAEEERTRERRKGEPAMGGSALKKVYRRGFVAGDTEGEVEIEGGIPEEGESRESLAEEPPEEMELEDNAVEEVDGMVARAATPPAHVRAFIPDDDDNPWA
ncbi:hypothetical protein PLICRDRAFT_116239 [Plicaturopsis crispa FD-325 SS-3]|nr:hypothetical protein PLICRDRAFT_116239 [Plicaturopsis crispa FD-325 SS-3]